VPGHLNRAVIGSGTVANDAKSKKRLKYWALSPMYEFVPVSVETLGVLSDSAMDFLHDLGRLIASVIA